MKNIIKLITTFFFITIIIPAFAEFKKQQFLLIEDQESKTSQQISYNIEKAMSGASLSTRRLEKKQLLDFSFNDISSFTGIIFTSDSCPDYLYGPDAKNFVLDGGILCFAHQYYSQEYISDFGVSLESGESDAIYEDARGVKSLKPIFNDEYFEMAKEGFTTGRIKLSFSAEWETVLNYINPENSLLLTRRFGKGSIIYWNSSCLTSKLFRGIFLFTLLKSLPISAMSVHNAFLMHIDDSPPPAYGIMEGPVARDFGMKDYDFHKRVWAKEVLPMLDAAGIKLTHFLTFAYDGKIKGPFLKQSDREPFFSEFLNILRKRGDDFGFHGYNHQSLTIGHSPSTPWKSLDEMLDAVKAGYKIWQKLGLPPTLCYVPPNNVIDKHGKLVLSEGFPSIRVICRVYKDYDNDHFAKKSTGYIAGLGKVDSKVMKKIYSLYASRKAMTSPKAREYFNGDEFGLDPEVPKFLDLPRLSSGHFLTEYEKLQILNGIMAHGIAVHFFHPDDIYDPARREKNWEYTLSSLKRLLLFFSKNFGFARKLHTSKFVQDFKKYVFGNSKIFSNGETKLKIQQKGRRFYYLFRRDASNIAPKITGGKIIAEVEKGKIFLIELKSQEANIEN